MSKRPQTPSQSYRDLIAWRTVLKNRVVVWSCGGLFEVAGGRFRESLLAGFEKGFQIKQTA